MFSFLEIFAHPARVFDRARAERIWITPFLAAVLLLSLPTVLVIFSGGGVELLTLQRYEHNAKLTEVVGGEEGVERAVNSSNDRWTKMLIVLKVAGTMAAALVGFSLALMLVSGFLDTRPPYFLTLSTLCYGVVPFALIGAIVTFLILQLTLDHSGLDLGNMPALNLSRLLDRDVVSGPIYSMAEGIDLLAAGEVFLVSFGLTRLTQLNYLQAVAICGGLWTVFALWKAALTVLL